jgi:hypothetical protein
LSSIAVPEQDVFRYHAESHGRLQAAAEHVFAHLDDHTRLSAHMSRRSWRMGWGRLHLHLDERAGRAVGSRIRLEGRVFGVRLALEEATLLVSFDPNYHGPEGVGVQQKAIRITAGNTREPLAEMRLTATIVDEPGTEGVPGSPKAGTHGRKRRH